METNDEFKEFYKTELKTKLEEIEKERLVFDNKMKRDRKKGVIVALGIAVLFSIGVQAMQEEGGLIDFLKGFAIFAPVLSLFGWILGSHFAMKKMLKLKKPFKEKIIAPIIQHFDSELEYQADKSISETEIKESQLFQEKIDYYTGDDFFEGKISNVKYRFSEKRLGIKIKKPDSQGHMKYVSHAIFKGVFLIAEFPENILDTFIIRPNPEFKEEDNQRRLVQKRSKFQQEFAKNKYTHWFSHNVETSKDLKPIKTNDSYFDEQFLVYSNEEREAKSLLNSGLKDFLIKLTNWEKEKAFNAKIEGHLQGNYQYPTVYFSIIGNKVYFGKPFDKHFFNPDLFKSILDEEVIIEFYQEIKELQLLMEKLILCIHQETPSSQDS